MFIYPGRQNLCVPGRRLTGVLKNFCSRKSREKGWVTWDMGMGKHPCCG